MKRDTLSFNTKEEACAFIQGLNYVDNAQPHMFRVGKPRLVLRTGKYNVTVTAYEY